MAEMDTVPRRPAVRVERDELVARPADRAGYQAYQLLHFAYVVAPTLAGLDKFFHRLTNWDKYLAPQIARLSPIGGHRLMYIVGAIEIVAGLIVALKPRIGAYIVALWLAGIITNLVLLRGFYDVALRDLGLFLGALALARLASAYEHGPHGVTRVARVKREKEVVGDIR